MVMTFPPLSYACPYSLFTYPLLLSFREQELKLKARLPFRTYVIGINDVVIRLNRSVYWLRAKKLEDLLHTTTKRHHPIACSPVCGKNRGCGLQAPRRFALPPMRVLRLVLP